jgi:hypothetical protein
MLTRTVPPHLQGTFAAGQAAGLGSDLHSGYRQQLIAQLTP